MPTWPDLDASLDYDAGWRQRFFEADVLGRYRPVARPVFHRVAEAVFGPDGALARLASGTAVAVYLEAAGVGLVLTRADQVPGGGGAEGSHVRAIPAHGGGHDATPDSVLAAVVPPASAPPLTTREVWVALASTSLRRLDPDPAAWPTRTPCC